MATATFELALPAGYTQSGSKLLPSGLSYDGTDYSGADGEYDVCNIDGTGQWTYEAVTIGAAQEPTGESATATFALSAPAGHDTTTLAADFDPYIFQGWDTQPSVGDQLVYATADNTTINSNADMETDAAGEVDIYHVSATGVWTYAPINYANLPVADSATVPAGTITIGTISTTEDSASVPFTYDLADATGYEHSTDGTTWDTVTSPVTRSGLTAETAYSGQIRPVNAEGPGTAVTYNFTTDAAAPTAPQGLITFGTASIAATSWSQPYSYDLADATGFEHRINNGNWVESTSPVEMLTADPETAYDLDVRAYNDTGTGSIASVTITTEADTSEPDPGETVVERVYTITASLDEMPSSQKISMYQGDRVRLNITHNFDMIGKQLKFRIAAKQGQPGKFTLITESNTMVITTALAELLNNADRAWQLILRDGESLVVVAEGSIDVRMRIKEGT